MNLSLIFQLLSTLIAVLGAFSAYRARDNARAATLSELQTDVKYILRRLDALEDRQRVKRMKKEESA